MVVPFGIGVGGSQLLRYVANTIANSRCLSTGDFLTVSKLIYRIGCELKKNAESAPE